MVAVAGSIVMMVLLAVLTAFGVFLLLDWVDDTEKLHMWQKVFITALAVVLIVAVAFSMAVTWFVFMEGVLG